MIKVIVFIAFITQMLNIINKIHAYLSNDINLNKKKQWKTEILSLFTEDSLNHCYADQAKGSKF